MCRTRAAGKCVLAGRFTADLTAGRPRRAPAGPGRTPCRPRPGAPAPPRAQPGAGPSRCPPPAARPAPRRGPPPGAAVRRQSPREPPAGPQTWTTAPSLLRIARPRHRCCSSLTRALSSINGRGAASRSHEMQQGSVTETTGFEPDRGSGPQLKSKHAFTAGAGGMTRMAQQTHRWSSSVASRCRSDCRRCSSVSLCCSSLCHFRLSASLSYCR